MRVVLLICSAFNFYSKNFKSGVQSGGGFKLWGGRETPPSPRGPYEAPTVVQVVAGMRVCVIWDADI